MHKVAFLFPGQGSQMVGMAQDLYEKHTFIRELFETGDKVLGFSITKLMFEGPIEKLTLTQNAQPALVMASLASYYALNIKPDYVAGHSLGEYSALVASEVLSYEDALHIVHERGKLMSDAPEGAMAAVLGADAESVIHLCEEISGVEPANFNCPGQIVISGQKEAIQQFQSRAKEIGAKRVIALEVSGPFHSSFMKETAKKLQELLKTFSFHDAKIPLISNVTGEIVTDAKEIQELLYQQVFYPVLWEKSMAFLLENQVGTFIELGPKKVLTGLMKKIAPVVRIGSVQTSEDIEEAICICKEK